MTRYCSCSERFMPQRQTTAGLPATRDFELTLVSASRLPNVRRLSGWRMKVYAEVSLDGGAVEKSDMDMAGGDNPTWNFKVHYLITESAVHTAGGNLKVRLLCKRSLRSSALIGEVEISVKNLLELGVRSEHDLAYPVQGTPNGNLKISYSFGVAKPLCV